GRQARRARRGRQRPLSLALGGPGPPLRRARAAEADHPIRRRQRRAARLARRGALAPLRLREGGEGRFRAARPRQENPPRHRQAGRWPHARARIPCLAPLDLRGQGLGRARAGPAGVAVITPRLHSRALRGAFQWRLLALWWASLLLPGALAAIPVAAFLRAQLDHSPEAATFVARLDGPAFIEILRQLGEN